MAAHKEDQRTLYKITQQVCGKFRNKIKAPIRNKKGQLLTSEAAREARWTQNFNKIWTEHFNQVLNGPAHNTEPDIQEAE
ncbi:hypothetical protein ElyMa_003638100 [Elysia marginata]|uniref:Uncharacterized protein n=1 Tax=Elysia marginata TaxID=1093978 RepID=A0AAV4EUI3_9GAST|nr:hypothetical protein ElyMa_003638100 [Elysia marginata]